MADIKELQPFFDISGNINDLDSLGKELDEKNKGLKKILQPVVSLPKAPKIPKIKGLPVRAEEGLEKLTEETILKSIGVPEKLRVQLTKKAIKERGKIAKKKEAEKLKKTLLTKPVPVVAKPKIEPVKKPTPSPKVTSQVNISELDRLQSIEKTETEKQRREEVSLNKWKGLANKTWRKRQADIGTFKEPTDEDIKIEADFLRSAEKPRAIMSGIMRGVLAVDGLYDIAVRNNKELARIEPVSETGKGIQDVARIGTLLLSPTSPYKLLPGGKIIKGITKNKKVAGIVNTITRGNPVANQIFSESIAGGINLSIIDLANKSIKAVDDSEYDFLDAIKETGQNIPANLVMALVFSAVPKGIKGTKNRIVRLFDEKAKIKYLDDLAKENPLEFAKRMFNLKKNFTRKEVLQKYKKYITKFHPDISKRLDGAEMTKQMNRAKEILDQHFRGIKVRPVVKALPGVVGKPLPEEPIRPRKIQEIKDTQGIKVYKGNQLKLGDRYIDEKTGEAFVVGRDIVRDGKPGRIHQDGEKKFVPDTKKIEVVGDKNIPETTFAGGKGAFDDEIMKRVYRNIIPSKDTIQLFDSQIFTKGRKVNLFNKNGQHFDDLADQLHKEGLLVVEGGIPPSEALATYIEDRMLSEEGLKSPDELIKEHFDREFESAFDEWSETHPGRSRDDFNKFLLEEKNEAQVRLAKDINNKLKKNVFDQENDTAFEIERVVKNENLSDVQKSKEILDIFTEEKTGLLSPEAYDLLRLERSKQAFADINSFSLINFLDEAEADRAIKILGNIVGKVANEENKLAFNLGGDEFTIIDGTVEDWKRISNRFKNELKKGRISAWVDNADYEKWLKIYKNKKNARLSKIRKKADGELFGFKELLRKGNKVLVGIDDISISAGVGNDLKTADNLSQFAKGQGLQGAILDKDPRGLDRKSIKDLTKGIKKAILKRGDKDVYKPRTERESTILDTKEIGAIEKGREQGDRLWDEGYYSWRQSRYRKDNPLSIKPTEELTKEYTEYNKIFNYKKTQPAEPNIGEVFDSNMRRSLDDKTGNTVLKREVYIGNNYDKEPQFILNNPNVGIVNKIFGQADGDRLVLRNFSKVKEILDKKFAQNLTPEQIDLMTYRLTGGGNGAIVLNNPYVKNFFKSEKNRNNLINEINNAISEQVEIQVDPERLKIANKQDVKDLRAKGILIEHTDRNTAYLKEFKHEMEFLENGLTPEKRSELLGQKLERLEIEETEASKRIFEGLTDEELAKRLKLPRKIIPFVKGSIENTGTIPMDIVKRPELEKDIISFREHLNEKAITKKYIEDHIPGSDFAKPYDNPEDAFNDYIKNARRVTKTLRQKENPSAVFNEKFEGIVGDWIGSKQLNEHRARVIANKLQQEIAKLTPGAKKKLPGILGAVKRGDPIINDQVELNDMSLQILLDTRDNTSLKIDFEKYKKFLTPRQRLIVLNALKMGPEFNKTKDLFRKMYKELAVLGRRNKLFQTEKDYYTARFWDGFFPKESGEHSFKPFTKHGKQRALDSILEGWAKGNKLAVEGASNSIRRYMEDIFNVVQDKAFLKLGRNLMDDTGKSMFSTMPLKGYRRITNPFFRWRGKDIHAPEIVAKHINNVLGRSKIRDIAYLKSLLKLNTIVKRNILFYSLFHHRALTTSYMLGGRTGIKNLDPVKSHKLGMKMIESLEPMTALGVKNGLTLDYDPVFDEELFGTKYKNRKKGIRSLAEKWNRSLFKRYAPGLKMMAFKFEFEQRLKQETKNIEKVLIKEGLIKASDLKNPAKTGQIEKVITSSPDIIDRLASESADLINDDFGGLNLARKGRSKTAQDLLKFGLLASDWTESNVASMIKAMPIRKDPNTGKGKWDAEKSKPFRKFWARAFTKGIIVANMINYAINGRPTFTNKDPDKKLDVDITRLVDPKGRTGKRHYYSILGHFRDPIKAVQNPIMFVKHKLSWLGQRFLNQMNGEDWAGRPYTEITKLIKDKRLVKKSSYSKKSRSLWKTMPSRLIQSGLSTQPIQVQNIVSFINGNLGGFEALSKSLGLPVETRFIPPFKNPFGGFGGRQKSAFKKGLKSKFKSKF